MHGNKVGRILQHNFALGGQLKKV